MTRTCPLCQEKFHGSEKGTEIALFNHLQDSREHNLGFTGARKLMDVNKQDGD